MILGAAYTLWMVKRVLFGVVASDRVKELQDIRFREGCFLTLLAACVLAMGVWPYPVLEVMHVSVENLLQHVSVSKLL